MFSLRLYNIMHNKSIMVHLTEVLVSYIRKFYVFHTAPVHCWNCSRDNFNVCSLVSLIVKRG